jgi:hypothetical protein
VAVALAASGSHRGAKPVDLVVAAAAEAAGLTVLHYDGYYDRISRVTRQPTEWVAAPSSLDRRLARARLLNDTPRSSERRSRS